MPIYSQLTDHAMPGGLQEGAQFDNRNLKMAWPGGEPRMLCLAISTEAGMVFCQNAQWAVTDWGLTSVKPGAPIDYEILANTLLDSSSHHGSPMYEWPIHMAKKTWVYLELFLPAFQEAIAVRLGKYKETLDPAIMAASVEYARCDLEGWRQ